MYCTTRLYVKNLYVHKLIGMGSLASLPYFSAYAHFRTRMRIRGKIRLARETRAWAEAATAFAALALTHTCCSRSFRHNRDGVLDEVNG